MKRKRVRVNLTSGRRAGKNTAARLDTAEMILQSLSSRLDVHEQLLAGRIGVLLKEAETRESLLFEREKVLDAIPPCPVHGKNCVPWALEWIADQRRPPTAEKRRRFVRNHGR